MMQNTNGTLLRDMRPGEEKTLLAMARQAFSHSPLEQLGIAKPETALVAEVGGAVAGAMFLKIYDNGDKKAGYLDVGFVAKEYRGHGVGRVMYPAAVARLREMGCDCVTAMVLDDNAASWKTLQNQGFGAPSLAELARLLGLGRAISLWLRTALWVACGARFWIDRPVKKRSTAGEMAAFFWVNLLLFVPGLLWLADKPEQMIYKLAAYACVLLAGVLFGAAGCLLAGGRWHFSFPRGGTLLTLMLNSAGAVFPMVGLWQPKTVQATKTSRRAVGVQAAVEWLGIAAVFALGGFFFTENLFLYHCAALAASLLVYRILFFMPFGGGRVWRWSKPAFVVLALGSAALLAPTMF